MEYENIGRKLKSSDYLKYALLDLLKEKNIHTITVKELCDRAMISRSTFYANYETLGIFIDSISHEVAVGLVDAVTDGGKNKSAILKRGAAEKLYTNWFKHVRNNYHFYKMFLSPNGPVEFNDFLLSQGVEWYTQLLRPCMARFEEMISIDVLANYIVNAHMGLLKYYIESNMKYSPEYMAKQLYLLTFGGPFSVLKLFDE